MTIAHLRIGEVPIRSAYLIHSADFVACHKQSYIGRFNMIEDLKPGGKFLLNCTWDQQALEEHLPAQLKRYIARNQIQFFTIDGVKIAKEVGLNAKINTVLQAAFFAISQVIPVEDAIRYMKEAAKNSYQRKGDKIVRMNYDAIDAGATKIVRIAVPKEWANA